MSELRVSDTLSVDVHTNGGDIHAVIARDGGGLVRIEVHELLGLVAALRAAAGELALALGRQERGRSGR